MLKTLQDIFDDLRALRPALQILLAVAILLAGAGVYFAINNVGSYFKIKRLEAQNFELNRDARSALEKAARAEKTAADEALRAGSLEAQLKTLQEKIQKSDETYKIQSEKSADLRGRLTRVRVSRPANVGTEDLERRLAERYRQAERSQ